MQQSLAKNIPIKRWRDVPKMMVKIAHNIVMVLALFTTSSLLFKLYFPKLDSNWLWINCSIFPQTILLPAFVASVLFYRYLGHSGKNCARIVTALVGGSCLLDTIIYYQLLSSQNIHTSFPVPLSLLLAIVLFLWCISPPAQQTTFRPLWMCAFLIGTSVFLLYLQIIFFGTTDYRRYGDAIVVFGAGVREDGSPSNALYDRTVTGCRLHQQGLAAHLVFSGGRNKKAPISEPQAMLKIAMAQGISPSAIILDEQGRNTLATVQKLRELAQRNNWQHILVVSHDYHLSRIKLTCHRAGLKVYTVPAYEFYGLALKPYYILREISAWCYYSCTAFIV